MEAGPVVITPQRAARQFVLLAACASAVTAVGCVSTYSAPRTVPAGSYRSYVIVEKASDPKPGEGTPPYPRFGLRYGLGDRVDLGVQLAPPGGALAGVKWNFVRGIVDLAAAPEVGMMVVGHAELGIVQSSVLAGVNLGRPVSVLITSGAGAWFLRGDCEHCRVETTSFARVGTGLRLRLSSWVTLQPEVTYQHPYSSSRDWGWVGGVGAALGRSAEYDELSTPAHP